MNKLQDESCRLSPFLVTSSLVYNTPKSQNVNAVVALPSIKELLSPSKSSSKLPIFVSINACNDKEHEMCQSQPILFQWCSKKIKNLPLSKGLSSQTKKLKVLLMARVEQENKCLAICYSNEFIIRSHQSQLSPKTKALRRQLVENKKNFKHNNRSFIHVGHHPINQPKFYISNVGEEQVQERNIMGDMGSEGRYPVVHFDGDYFERVTSSVKITKSWLDFCLVDPKPNQATQILAPFSVSSSSVPSFVETTSFVCESNNKRKREITKSVTDPIPFYGHHWKKSRLLDGSSNNFQSSLSLSNGISIDFNEKHTIPLSRIQHSNQIPVMPLYITPSTAH